MVSMEKKVDDGGHTILVPVASGVYRMNGTVGRNGSASEERRTFSDIHRGFSL